MPLAFFVNHGTLKLSPPSHQISSESMPKMGDRIAAFNSFLAHKMTEVFLCVSGESDALWMKCASWNYTQPSTCPNDPQIGLQAKILHIQSLY